MGLNPSLTSLQLFKDWSSALLTTTVVALGWAASGKHQPLSRVMQASIVCLLGSVIAGVLSLALIPSVAEGYGSGPTLELYQTPGKLYWLGAMAPPVLVRLIVVCWPQHALFLFGVTLYVCTTLWPARRDQE